MLTCDTAKRTGEEFPACALDLKALAPLSSEDMGSTSKRSQSKNSPYPPIGSKWKERDLRVSRTIEVVRYDVANGRVRINCIETQRLSWAKPERFNGKSGGYARIG